MRRLTTSDSARAGFHGRLRRACHYNKPVVTLWERWRNCVTCDRTCRM